MYMVARRCEFYVGVQNELAASKFVTFSGITHVGFSVLIRIL